MLVLLISPHPNAQRPTHTRKWHLAPGVGCPCKGTHDSSTRFTLGCRGMAAQMAGANGILSTPPPPPPLQCPLPEPAATDAAPCSGGGAPSSVPSGMHGRSTCCTCTPRTASPQQPLHTASTASAASLAGVTGLQLCWRHQHLDCCCSQAAAVCSLSRGVVSLCCRCRHDCCHLH